ncbi:MAG TPA: hypothetical protein VFL73_05455, partial [Solirubrobacteraceae bacterium]|nr:hypothetical protein [Solirubrobacteraceae bacterium]
MSESLRRAVGGAALVAALLVAGCSSSGSGAHKSASSSPSSSSTSPVTSSPAPSASGTPADAATRKAVADAYAAFFGYKSTLAQSQAALQHGATFHQTLVEQGKSSLADKSTATVSSVRVAGKVAYVTFTISENGQPLLSNTPGYAVRENGTWKVAAKTFCSLLTLQGSAPSACSDPSITALPH